jgi:hypothetical protein
VGVKGKCCHGGYWVNVWFKGSLSGKRTRGNRRRNGYLQKPGTDQPADKFGLYLGNIFVFRVLLCFWFIVFQITFGGNSVQLIILVPYLFRYMVNRGLLQVKWMSKNTIAIFSSLQKFNHLAAVYQARFDGAIKEPD